MAYEHVRNLGFNNRGNYVEMTLVRRPSQFSIARWRRYLAPGICLLCHQHTGITFDLCRTCLRALPANTLACSVCALPLVDIGDARACAACNAAPPIWDRAVAGFRYAPPVDAMIHRIKYGGSLCDARVLGNLLAHRLAVNYGHAAIPELITPIPLSWRRLLRRGHNQAALIARYVGQRLKMRVHYDVLRRTRHTPAQAQLSRSARLNNLNGAFRVHRLLPAPRVALVDDVMTTGATLGAATSVLKAAGAAEVHLWVVARTGQR